MSIANCHLEKANHILYDEYPNRVLQIHSVISSFIITEDLEPFGEDRDTIHGWLRIEERKIPLFNDISFGNY